VFIGAAFGDWMRPALAELVDRPRPDDTLMAWRRMSQEEASPRCPFSSIMGHQIASELRWPRLDENRSLWFSQAWWAKFAFGHGGSVSGGSTASEPIMLPRVMDSPVAPVPRDTTPRQTPTKITNPRTTWPAITETNTQMAQTH
jgi:hypothetical protein